MEKNHNNKSSNEKNVALNNDVSKKDGKPISFKKESQQIFKSKPSLEVLLSFFNSKERAKFLIPRKNDGMNRELSQSECMRKDALYANYLYCINNDPAMFKEIADNIFESDYEQLNKELEKSEEEIQDRFNFDKEKKEIMACMRPYLKIYMYQMILVEIFSLTRKDFDADGINIYSKISECIENIIKNNENQQKRIDKILDLVRNEQTKEVKNLTENKQIREIKNFGAKITEIRVDKTCQEIKENNKHELRNLMYSYLLRGLLEKTIFPEIDQLCDAKDKTVEEIQVEIAKNQREIEKYKKDLSNLQDKAKKWNILLALAKSDMIKKEKNANENKKSEIEQNQPPAGDLENKNILLLNNNNLEVSLDDLKSSIEFCDENIKINKAEQEKIEKEISNREQNIKKFKRQESELDVQKDIQNAIKDIKKQYNGKLSDDIFDDVLEHPSILNDDMQMEGIIKCCYGEDRFYYDDKVDFVSHFIGHALNHHNHENFLLAIIEASKLLHKLLESDYSPEEEEHWRRGYYKYIAWYNNKTEYFRDKRKAWGYRHGKQFRRAMLRNRNDIDNDLYDLIDNFLLHGRYCDYSGANSDPYVLRSWYDNNDLSDWTFPDALIWTAISFAIFFVALGIILGFTYLIAGACVAFFVMLSLLCASAVTAITFFTVFGIKLKAANKKVETRKLAIDKNKEKFHTEFIKSNMWWWLFPHGFMWTAISFAIAFGHFGAITLALYCTGVAFSGVLYFSLSLAACSAVLFMIFGIRVWMQKRKYENWTSQMDKLQEDRQNINKPQKLKEFYDKYLTINKDQNDQKQNLSKPKTEIANEIKTQ